MSALDHILNALQTVLDAAIGVLFAELLRSSSKDSNLRDSDTHCSSKPLHQGELCIAGQLLSDECTAADDVHLHVWNKHGVLDSILLGNCFVHICCIC